MLDFSIRRHPAFAFLTAMVCALLLAGCAHKPRPDHHVVTQTVNLKTEPAQTRVIDPKSRVIGEAHSFRVTQMRSTTIDNLLRVQVEVLNDRGRRDVLYYRVRWLDQTGVMQGQYEPWQTESFEGGQSSLISFEAPADKAADFRFEIKPQY